MRRLMILLPLFLFACETNYYYEDCDSGVCDSGECEECDAGDCGIGLCCFYYPSGDPDHRCGLEEGLDEYECRDLAEATFEEFPSPDGVVYWASVPLVECWMWEPEWCRP